MRPRGSRTLCAILIVWSRVREWCTMARATTWQEREDNLSDILDRWELLGEDGSTDDIGSACLAGGGGLFPCV